MRPGIHGQQEANHQRSSAEPQVKPPPIASSMTRCPGLMRPSATATSSASGMEAAEVLPCRSTVETTLSVGDAELPGARVDDPLIGLVRHEPVDVVGGGAGRLEGGVDDVGDHADRVLEDLAPLHAHMADGAGRRRPAVDVELFLVLAVGAEMRGEHAAVGDRARALLRFQHDRAGAVAEEHAGRAVAPVEDAREGLRADDQRALPLPGLQHRVGRGERIDEAGADRLQVERRARMDAEIVLDGHGARRKSVVRRRGGEHDQVDVRRLQPGVFERLSRRGGRHDPR